MGANRIRRAFRPYDRPRPWPSRQVARSVQYVLDLTRNWEIGFHDAEIADWICGRHVLELGPGPDLGTGLILLARGASSYVAVDRFPLLGSTPAAFYELLLQRIANEPHAGRAAAAYEAFRRGTEDGDLRYVLLTDDPRSIARPQGPPADLWLSHAALEHVAEPLPLLRTLSSWCAGGALALHHVDAATHTPWIRDADPLNILRYGDRLYKVLSFPGSPNRWRSRQFVDCFESLGWTLLDDQPVHRLSERSLEHVRPALARRFRGLDAEELAMCSFRLVLRKERRTVNGGEPRVT